MSPQYRRCSQGGFTLIEVLVAMALLSFGLLAIASMQVVAIQVNASAQRLNRGTTLVQDKIEELLALPFTHASLNDATPVDSCTEYTEANPEPGYALRWCVDTSADGNSKNIRVQADWTQNKDPKQFWLWFTKTIFQ
jgi:type IV pilus modification protein PilV